MPLFNRRAFLKAAALGAAALTLRQPVHAENVPFRMYLTFDDGPTTNPDGSGATTTILDILKQESVRATFFLHGIAINDWEGGILARIIQDGHAIGNHLWRQGGNTVEDESPMALLAQQYILCERRVRSILEAANPDAYAKYLAQPRLFRRPGGNNGLNSFLDLKNFTLLENAPFLRGYRSEVAWLKGVYDYSGWHLTNGDSVPQRALYPVDEAAMLDWVIRGRGAYQGVESYLCTGNPPRRAAEVRDGLILLMHDAAPLTQATLPAIIKELRQRGATFHTLPRPIDQPNAPTVGIGYAPTPDPYGRACSG
ncbi:MAG: twin-arginine translocation signal domain-containing protein [Chloroflexi bacterium CFX4]|nr:twin-arginine translocation signal domain-containing protein [Chloroflexi bacterium CFX4]MDL1922723.1 twin-arginine translocation signal domain-containing protein [Chloroflexi bacterium CFX3]